MRRSPTPLHPLAIPGRGSQSTGPTPDLIIANLIGAKSCIYVKDEDGLYTDNPKTNPKASFIPEIGVKELLKRDLEDLIVERSCLEILSNCESVDRIQIVNGLKKGTIIRALNGKKVGTLIYRD